MVKEAVSNSNGALGLSTVVFKPASNHFQFGKFFIKGDCMERGKYLDQRAKRDCVHFDGILLRNHGSWVLEFGSIYIFVLNL